MKSAKNLLMVAAAFALAMILFVIAAPKAAHALVATLVQVTNTSANPVPTSDAAVRFQTAVCAVTGPVSTATNFCAPNSTTFVVPTVTSGGAAVKRLVLENVSGFCSNFDNSSLVMQAVRLRGQFVPDSVPNGLTSFTHYVPIVAPAHSYINEPGAPFPYSSHPESDYTYGETAHFAYNPGDTVSLEAFFSYTGAGAVDYFCISRAEGYLVTQ